MDFSKTHKESIKIIEGAETIRHAFLIQSRQFLQNLEGAVELTTEHDVVDNIATVFSKHRTLRK